MQKQACNAPPVTQGIQSAITPPTLLDRSKPTVNTVSKSLSDHHFIDHFNRLLDTLLIFKKISKITSLARKTGKSHGQQ
jgi:hypothetical protein